MRIHNLKYFNFKLNIKITCYFTSGVSTASLVVFPQTNHELNEREVGGLLLFAALHSWGLRPLWSGIKRIVNQCDFSFWPRLNSNFKHRYSRCYREEGVGIWKFFNLNLIMAVGKFTKEFFPFKKKKSRKIAAQSEKTLKTAEYKIHYIQLKNCNRIRLKKNTKYNINNS